MIDKSRVCCRLLWVVPLCLLGMAIGYQAITVLSPGSVAFAASEKSGAASVDMDAVLSHWLAEKQTGEISIYVRTNAQALVAPPGTASLPIMLGAHLFGEPSDTVTYVASTDLEQELDAGIWQGEVFSAPVAAPYYATLDLAPLLRETGPQDIVILGLVNAVPEADGQTFSYDYAAINPIYLRLTVSALDMNQNAYPSDPRLIEAGEAWYAEAAVPDGMRRVGVLNLDGLFEEGALSLNVGDVTVTAPSMQAIRDSHFDGPMQDQLQGLWLMLSLGPSPASLVDDVDGESAAQTLAAWGEQVVGQQPGALAGIDDYLEVSMVYELADKDGDDAQLYYAKLDELPLGVVVDIINLELEYPDTLAIWGLSTQYRTEPAGISGAMDTTHWTLRDAYPVIVENSLVAFIDEFSILAPLASKLQLNSVTPHLVPIEVAAPLTLRGIFRNNSALTAQQARQAYHVYVGDTEVDFREVNGVAVTPYDGSEQEMYVTLPAQSTPADLDVWLFDAQLTDNYTFLHQAVSVLEELELLMGDVNMDGQIDETDLALIQAYLAGDIVLDPGSLSYMAADLNGDGQITADDALLLEYFLRAGGAIEEAPLDLRAASGAGQVMLQWRPVNHLNLAGYAVFRRFAEGGEFVQIAQTPHPRYVDTNVETAAYEYYVAPIDMLGNLGPASNIVFVWGNTVRVRLPETVWALPESTLRVPIFMGNTRGVNPEQMLFELHYDPQMLQFERFERTTLSLGAALDATHDAVNGVLTLSTNDPNNTLLNGEGRFLDIVFTVLATEKDAFTCAALELDRVELFGMDGAPLHVELESGNFCVGDEGLMGDVNADRVVDRDDAQKILDIVVGKVESTPYHYMVGDLNGDVRLDSADAVILLRMLAGESVNPDAEMDYASYEDVRSVTLEERIARRGAQFRMPIRMSDFSGIYGGDLTLLWPKDECRFEAVHFGEALADWNVDVNAQDGRLHLSFAGLPAADHTGEALIAEVIFTATAEPPPAGEIYVEMRISDADFKLPFGESYLWFGDLNLGQTMITVYGDIAPKFPTLCGIVGDSAGSRWGTWFLGLLLVAACMFYAVRQSKAVRDD